MCDQKQCDHVVKCGNCKGTGRDPQFHLIKECGVCKGVGSVLLK